jgi:peptide/nickel transport system permease protein
MIMPAFVLSNAIAAIMMRHTRAAMLQVMGMDYIRTARAKGPSGPSPSSPRSATPPPPS